jgi:prevent-host-death family protein
LKARQNLGTLLEEVYYRDDQFIIEHAGKPMAAVVPVWQLEEWQKHSSRQKKSTDAIKKTNVNRPRDDPERAYAALSLRMPHIPSMHLPLGSMHLPLNAGDQNLCHSRQARRWQEQYRGGLGRGIPQAPYPLCGV